MTGQERDYDEVISRVLHSTTDQIEPVGDGLTKIQARLAEPWLKRQWWLLRSEFMILGWVFAVRCQSWFNTLRSGSAAGEDAADGVTDDASTTAGAAGHGGRLRSLPVLGGIVAWASPKRSRGTGGPLRGSVGPAMAWLRPALAVAGAVVLVVAGVFALGQIRSTFVGLENDNPLTPSSSAHGSGPGSTNGHGGRAVSSGPSATHQSATSAKPGSTPNAKVVAPSPAACSPAGTPPVISPTPTPTSTSPTPSPTATTPTPTPTTPTPTPTVSQAPMTGGQFGGGQVQVQGIKTTALVVCEHTPNPNSSPTNQATAGP